MKEILFFDFDETVIINNYDTVFNFLREKSLMYSNNE